MKKFLILLYLLLVGIRSFSYSQEISLKIDSVRISYVPWNLQTTISWDKSNLIDNSEVYNKSIVIRDKNILLSLSNALQKKQEDSIHRVLNTRMLIEVFTSEIVIDIILDPYARYSYNGLYFIRNKELIEWINTNVTTTR